MKDEKKVLGILAIVFGGIALVGSWVPILNNISFFIAVVALILGVVALIVNRKNKKVLAIIGTCLSLASIIIVLATQSMYGSALDSASKAVDEASSSIDAEYSKSSSEEASKEAAPTSRKRCSNCSPGFAESPPHSQSPCSSRDSYEARETPNSGAAREVLSARSYSSPEIPVGSDTSQNFDPKSKKPES